jgi:hypothetical protein
MIELRSSVFKPPISGKLHEVPHVSRNNKLLSEMPQEHHQA